MKRMAFGLGWMALVGLAVMVAAGEDDPAAKPAPKAKAEIKAKEETDAKPAPKAKAEAKPKADAKAKAKKEADDDDPDPKPKKEPKEPAPPKEKLVTLGTNQGTLEGVDAAQKTLKIRVGAGKLEQHLSFPAADEIKVRLLQPPKDFDDKGRPKRYTAKELQALRGPDRKLPGYTAEFENLRAGQIVRFTVVKKKDPPKTYGKKKKDDDELPVENKPQISLIVILVDPPH